MSRTGETRERLLSAALDLIWTSSYGSVGVDDICTQAGVKKGSFYHFFPSKADLALAAYDEHWSQRQPKYDVIFSPREDPVERLMRWCQFIRDNQMRLHAQHGFICGCPYCNIGSELGTQDERLRVKAQLMMQRTLTYLESAVRDANRLGLANVKDEHQAAKAVQSCVVGQMLLAKMHNDPLMLDHLEDVVLRQIGARELVTA